jgi:hypothetical protein
MVYIKRPSAAVDVTTDTSRQKSIQLLHGNLVRGESSSNTGLFIYIKETFCRIYTKYSRSKTSRK